MSTECNILRLYICGPHSTGKTTLLNDLKPYLGDITVAHEVARGIIRDHGWKREDYLPAYRPDMFLQLNKEILEKQIQLEKEYTENRKDFICDRAIDPLVYAHLYVGEQDKEDLYQTPGLHTWLEHMRESLVFLLSPHKECCLDDNVRMPPKMEELETFHAVMETELKRNMIPYHKITVLDRSKRVEAVLNALEVFKKSNGFL